MISVITKGRPLRDADLLTAKAMWLLEVRWSGRVYLWATELPDGIPLVITDANGTDHEYRGGVDLSFSSRFDLFSGPIYDNQGNLLVEEGMSFEQADFDQFPPGAEGLECDYCMYWWADGITAELPELGD